MSLHTVASRIYHGVANRIEQKLDWPAPRHTAEKTSRLEKFFGSTLGALKEVGAAVPQALAAHGFFSAPPILRAPAANGKFRPLPPPPLSLQQYVRLNGPSPQYAHYLATLDNLVSKRPLDTLAPTIQPGNQIAKGSSQDYYRCGPDHVVGLVERAGRPVTQDAVLMSLLRRSGLPVAASRMGQMESAYRGDPKIRTSAVVTERLSGCLNFERMGPRQHRDFLSSARLNETTLNSLISVRSAMSKEQIDISGLKGGIRRDGTFVLRAPRDISRRDPGNHGAAQGRANLDRLIDDVRRQLSGGQRRARQA